MPLLEMQIPTKADFNGTIQSDATNLNNIDHKSADVAEFLAEFTSVVLQAPPLNIPSVDVPAYAEYRTMLQELQEWFAGNMAEQTVIPRDIIDKFRRMK